MDGIEWRDGLATVREIRAVLGDSDDVVTSSVVELAPTRAELLEAQAWLTSEDAPGPSHAPQGKVALICEIVGAELPEAGL